MAFDDYCGNGIVRFEPFPRPGPAGELEPVHELGASFRIPGRFTHDELARMQTDASLMADILAANPDGALAFLNAVASGDYGMAREQAEAIGLSEELFVKQGGGWWWLLVFTIFAATTLAHD